MALRLDREVDDLLELMGGGPSSAPAMPTSTSRAHPPSSSDGRRGKGKKTKKKKRTKERRKDAAKSGGAGEKASAKSTSDDVKEKVASYADTRLTQNCFEWPRSTSGRRFLSLGPGLMHYCSGYGVDGGRYGASVCNSCGRSGAAHELRSNDDRWFDCTIGRLGRIVVASRNARCIMGEYHPAEDNVNTKEGLKTILPPAGLDFFNQGSISEDLDSLLGIMLRSTQELGNRRGQFVTKADVQVLKEKVSSLVQAAEGFKKAVLEATSQGRVGNSWGAINLIERRLAAMAACDAVYYRCYYMAAVAKKHIDGGSDLAAMIPHPPTYFSCPGLAWDAGDAGTESLRLFLGHPEDKLDLGAPLDNETRGALLKSWGLKDRLSPTPKEHPNPLLALWQSRFMETIRHVWVSRYSVMKSPRALRTASAAANDTAKGKAVQGNSQALLQMHEANALSPRMAQWRDSVRDYPANFYAYAAPTKEALQCISDCVRSLGVKQILEAGAGTGYWSALLRSHLSVEAEGVPAVVPYDIAPSSAIANASTESDDDSSYESWHQHSPQWRDITAGMIVNDYHGLIPTFLDVKKADSLGQALPSATSGAKTALLLCYPPPGSDMAHQAVTAHMSNGGQIVMHVGEWQGLTGDAAFEDLLRRNFYCSEQEVVPLPMWGTDATYLTVWRKKSESQSAGACSPAVGYCSVQDCSNLARRRCRFGRCLQYCSVECCQKHCARRRSVLAVHMLHTSSTEDTMKYEDDGHFMDLRQSSSTTRDVESDRPRKKRKKKRR